MHHQSTEQTLRVVPQSLPSSMDQLGPSELIAAAEWTGRGSV